MWSIAIAYTYNLLIINFAAFMIYQGSIAYYNKRQCGIAALQHSNTVMVGL